MFQFSTHMELSRSMAAILEMPQYVAYQKNVVYAFIKLSAKSHSFNILCTMDGLSCPTMYNHSQRHRRLIRIANWSINTFSMRRQLPVTPPLKLPLWCFLTFLDIIRRKSTDRLRLISSNFAQVFISKNNFGNNMYFGDPF